MDIDIDLFVGKTNHGSGMVDLLMELPTTHRKNGFFEEMRLVNLAF